MVLLGCNLVCHVGVLSLHLIKGGCNGIGAWVLNSVLNGAILLLFLKFYVEKRKFGISEKKEAAAVAAAESAAGVKEKKFKVV